MTEEVQGLRTELGEFKSSEAEYERLLDEKERLLAQAGGDQAKQLLDFSERLADFSAKHREGWNRVQSHRCLRSRLSVRHGGGSCRLC